VGANSNIAKGEWALQIELLNFLVLKKDWSKLFEVTAKLLSESRANNSSGKVIDARGADWAVWKAFMNPAIISNPEYVLPLYNYGHLKICD
jgi:N-terminal acetyltransferase B complex non-catalytic subunit